MSLPRAFLVLLVAGGLVYANALSSPFHFDDHHSVEYNPHIRSLTQLPAFFVDPSLFSSRPQGYMYRPLLLSSYAVDHALWGTRAAGFRITNLLLHVAAAALFAVWVRRLQGGAGAALAAGLVFVVHPVHGEAVNYISSRADILVALLSLAAFLTLGARPAAGRAGAGLAAYAGALLSKSVGVMVPALLLGHEAVRGGWKRVRVAPWRWLGLAVLTAAYLAMLASTRFLQASGEKLPRSWGVEVWTQVKSLAYYGWLYVSPVHLSVDHAFQVSASASNAASWAAAALALSLCAWAWRGRRGAPGFGWAWFVVALLPYLLTPLNILVAERRTYLAGCGLFLVGLWVWRQAGQRAALRPVGIALLAVFAVLTGMRNEVWATQVGVWRDAVAKNPAGVRARVNLALALKRAGEAAEARVQLRRGLEMDPGFAEGWVVLGDLHQDAGDLDGAEGAYRRAAGLDPSLAGVQHNLGNVAMARERADEAVARYRRALELDPDFAEARNNLGQALERTGDLAGACEQYRRAVADSALWVHTDDPVGGAWYNLASCAERLGRLPLARQAYAEAARRLQADPRFGRFAETARARLRALQEATP